MESDISSEWEQIQSPLIIKEDSYDESSVFPPTDHQDLPINTSNENNQESQPLDSVQSPSDGVRIWRRILLKLDLRRGVLRIARRVENCATCKVFAILAPGGVGAVLLVLYLLRAKALMWWQRRMKFETSKGGNNLMLIINQKDKRINELLLQVAQMNEILLARRRVQVIRVN